MISASLCFGVTKTHLLLLVELKASVYDYGKLQRDFNRDICRIDYNYLALPSFVLYRHGHRIEYTYDAAGSKLRTKHLQSLSNMNLGYYYNDPKPTLSNPVITTTDYVLNKVYVNGTLQQIITEHGYVDLSGSAKKSMSYLKDHQGNNRIVIDQTGAMVHETAYYPSGTTMWDSGMPRKFSDKELDKTFDLNFYDFEARQYDPVLMRFTTHDPMREKYYGVSPYVYCMNNPVRFVDPDGRDVKLYNIIKLDNSGNAVVASGVSSTTNAALKDLVGTKEGLAFFSQFAKAGDVVGGHTFTENGKLSDVTLNLWDYSYEKGEMPSYAQPNSGSIGVSNDKSTVTLKVVSAYSNKTEVGETLTHETQIHGFDVSNQINGKSTTTESQDHKALKNQDTKHQGYKQYQSVQKQLENTDENYKKAFQNAQKEYQNY